PYSEDYEVSLQRQFGVNTVLSMSYVGTQGHHLISFLESNPGNQALCLALSQPSALAPGVTPCGPNLEGNTFVTASGKIINGTRQPLGNLLATNAYMDEMANSNYNSLQVSLRHTSASSSFLVGYTYSKCLSNSSTLTEGIDPLNFAASKALCAFDLTHNFVVSYSVRPFDRFAFTNSKVGSRAIKGWEVTGITTFATGLGVSLSENDDNSLLGTNTGVDLPNYTPGNILSNTNPRNGQAYFNTSLFSPEPVGQLGNSNRRFFHGPGINNFDLALLKDFEVTESKKFEFRLEAFNAFNHAQFNNPNGNVNAGAGSFGYITGARDPRILQMALKFVF
ncbi:MAG: TonB-dependent receptor, partial [Terriglobia bacterium]